MKRVWLEFTDPGLLGRAAASHVGRLARSVLEDAPIFRLALSGGASPLGMFRHLTAPDIFPARFWKRTHIFFVDERLVPPDHPDSNFGSVARHLLDCAPIPAQNIHRMLGELPPNEAARAYAADLARSFGQSNAPIFDLIVLGMGADGHTASLFPDAPSPDPRHPVVTPVPTPRLSPHVPRLTLTPAVLNAARQILFVIQGTDKHPALRAIRAGNPSLPAAQVDARRQSWYICPPLQAGHHPIIHHD